MSEVHLLVGYMPQRVLSQTALSEAIAKPVDALPFGPELKMAQVEDIKRWLQSAPVDSRSQGRAAIIDLQGTRADVQNSLLLFLEDPPPNVCIILTVEEEDQVLPTIRSRCQVQTFFPPSYAEIVKDYSEWLGISGAVQVAALLRSGVSGAEAPLPTPATFVLVDQLLQLLEHGTIAQVFGQLEVFGPTELLALRLTLITRAVKDKRYLAALLQTYQSSDSSVAAFLSASDILLRRMTG